jgi:hypothetical protein
MSSRARSAEVTLDYLLTLKGLWLPLCATTIDAGKGYDLAKITPRLLSLGTAALMGGSALRTIYRRSV